MTTNSIVPITLILSLLFAVACGSKSEKKATGSASTAPSASAAGGASANDPKFSFNDPATVEAAEKRQYLISEKDLPPLSSLLPARIGRYKKIYEKSERGGPEVMMLYSAWADYRTPENDAIILHITDAGQRPEYQQKVVEWARKEVNIKNDRGYEKSILFDGYPGFEKYYPKLSSEIGILVANRYIVNVACQGCELEVLREAMRTVPLKRLEVLQ